MFSHDDKRQINVIAVDMDGTFLNDQMIYNKKRFYQQFNVFDECQIKFIVASGNQYYQLKSFFESIAEKISFVAENGALVVDKGEIVHISKIEQIVVDKVISVLVDNPELTPIICGVNSAYILSSCDNDYYNHMSLYYHRLKKINSYNEIDDVIIKFALVTPDNGFYESHLNSKLPREIKLVSSGHNSIDLVPHNTNKAIGINKLLDKWGHSFDNCMAFGDSNNDLEMLDSSKYSFAMENGNEQVKKVAKYTAPTNNNDGVLTVVESYLKLMSSTFA